MRMRIRERQADSPFWRRLDAGADALLARPTRPAAIALILATLIAALLWPNAADGLLRLLLVILAIGYIVLRGYRTLPPLLDDRFTPFGRNPLLDDPPVAPEPLRRLLKLLDGGRAGGRAGEAAIPGAILRTLREEAGRRLADRHRLDVHDTADHPRIRLLVGDPTWEVIRPPPTRAAPTVGPTRSSRTVPLHHLDRIIDDLETL